MRFNVEQLHQSDSNTQISLFLCVYENLNAAIKTDHFLLRSARGYFSQRIRCRMFISLKLEYRETQVSVCTYYLVINNVFHFF